MSSRKRRSRYPGSRNTGLSGKACVPGSALRFASAGMTEPGPAPHCRSAPITIFLAEVVTEASVVMPSRRSASSMVRASPNTMPWA